VVSWESSFFDPELMKMIDAALAGAIELVDGSG
jgi:hypothetical protein